VELRGLEPLAPTVPGTGRNRDQARYAPQFPPGRKSGPNSAEPCRADVLAYFAHHTSNEPTEAINGRLEPLRRNAFTATP
jgi:hypothetical protein